MSCRITRLLGVSEIPSQPAIQTVYSFIANVTLKRQIIKIVTKSKICSKHGQLINEGSRDKFNPGVWRRTSRCITQKRVSLRGYWEGGLWQISFFCEDVLEMWEVINGLDSSTGRVAVSLYTDGLLENKPCHYIDTPDLSESIRKANAKETRNLLRSRQKELKQRKPNFCITLPLMLLTGVQLKLEM